MNDGDRRGHLRLVYSGTGNGPPIKPRSLAEWQRYVDTAHALMLVESVRESSLFRAGPINREACEDVVARGKARGVTPSKDAVERFLLAFKEPEL